MNFKEVTKLAATAAVIALAGTVVGAYAHLAIFEPVAPNLTAAFFQQMIIMALVCGALCFIFYSRKELDAVHMRVRMGIHFTATVAAVLALALYWRWILPRFTHIALVVVCIVLAYVAVIAAMFWSNKATADRLNDIIRRNKEKKQ